MALAFAVAASALAGSLALLARGGFGRSLNEGTRRTTHSVAEGAGASSRSGEGVNQPETARSGPTAIPRTGQRTHPRQTSAEMSVPLAGRRSRLPSTGHLVDAASERVGNLSASQLAAIFTGFVCLAVYVATMRPGVSFGDSAEFQRVPFEVGILHPTGFPVYVLLGKLFSLIPIGSIAWRANFLSAVAASGAAAVAALSMGRFGVRPIVAAAAAALTLIVWTEATTAEVSAVHLLFVSLLIHRALLWRDGRRPRDLYVGALLLGLAAVNHPTAIALAPLFIVYVAWVGRDVIWARPTLAVRAGLAFLLGITPVLYLAVRAVVGGNDLYRFIATWDGFTYWITGAQLHVSMNKVLSFTGPGNFVSGLPGWLALSADRSTPIFVGFALVGVVAVWLRDRSFALFSASVVALSVYLFVNYIPTLERYLLVVMLIMAIWMGVGLEWLIQRVPKRLARVSVVSLVIPILLAASYWPAMNQSENHLGEQFVAGVFARMPPGAVILSYWDAVQPLGYEHCVEGWRPDIAVFSPFDRDYQGCDPYSDLQTLVSSRPVYALLLFQSEIEALGGRFQLTKVAEVMAPFGGRQADFPCALYRVDPKPVARGANRPEG